MIPPCINRIWSQLPETAASTNASVQIEQFDARWTACKRPVAMAGGEMTLDMLDLRWDPATKTYDAPLHMKALNGVFLMDDFGRQKASPTDILNRWDRAARKPRGLPQAQHRRHLQAALR